VIMMGVYDLLTCFLSFLIKSNTYSETDLNPLIDAWYFAHFHNFSSIMNRLVLEYFLSIFITYYQLVKVVYYTCAVYTTNVICEMSLILHRWYEQHEECCEDVEQEVRN